MVNTDLAPIYTCAIPDSKKEGTLRKRCRHRPVQYLNNILEQEIIEPGVNPKNGTVKEDTLCRKGNCEWQRDGILTIFDRWQWSE